MFVCIGNGFSLTLKGENISVYFLIFQVNAALDLFVVYCMPVLIVADIYHHKKGPLGKITACLRFCCWFQCEILPDSTVLSKYTLLLHTVQIC